MVILEKINDIHRRYKELNKELSSDNYKKELVKFMEELKGNYDVTDDKECKGMAKTFYNNLEIEFNSL